MHAVIQGQKGRGGGPLDLPLVNYCHLDVTATQGPKSNQATSLLQPTGWVPRGDNYSH